MTTQYIGPKYEAPSIIIDPYTLQQYQYIVDKIGNLEAEWYGFSRYDEENHLLIVYGDALIPEQTVSGTSASVTSEQMGKFMEYVDDHCEGKKYNLTNMNVHMHSHVNMAVSPSTTDETQKVELAQDYRANYLDDKNEYNERYLLKGIMNKKGELFLEVIDLENWLVKSTTWSGAWYGSDLDRFEKEIKGISKYVAPVTNTYNYNNKTKPLGDKIFIKKDKDTAMIELEPYEAATILYELAGTNYQNQMTGKDLKQFDKVVKNNLETTYVVPDDSCSYAIHLPLRIISFDYGKKSARLYASRSVSEITTMFLEYYDDKAEVVSDELDHLEEIMWFYDNQTMHEKFYHVPAKNTDVAGTKQ